jgi:hypothetical protein
MDFGKFYFGRIEIDGVTYERDVVIDRRQDSQAQEEALEKIPLGSI